MGIIARLKGEEPNVFKQIPHMLKGKGHYGEYLAEYASTMRSPLIGA